MKRTLITLFLVGVSVVCFWLAIADIFTPPPAHKGGAANPSADANGSPGGAGTPGGAGGGPASASSPTSAAAGRGSHTSAASASSLQCQVNCQKDGNTCQSSCYQQYNVTNQTRYWTQCMQGCGTKLSVCSNNCIAGTSLPAISTVLPPPPHAAPTSAPARSPPPLGQQDDLSPSSSSSSSSSSSGH